MSSILCKQSDEIAEICENGTQQLKVTEETEKNHLELKYGGKNWKIVAFFGLGHILHGLFGQNYHVDID